MEILLHKNFPRNLALDEMLHDNVKIEATMGEIRQVLDQIFATESKKKDGSQENVFTECL